MRAAEPAPLRRALASAILALDGAIPRVWPREPLGSAEPA
jgi:hypothetical protein